MKKTFTSVLLISLGSNVVAQQKIVKVASDSALVVEENTEDKTVISNNLHPIHLATHFTNSFPIGTGIQATTSGAPGDGKSLAMRGYSNMYYEQAPTILLDGMPYLGSLSSINPYSISDIKVVRSAIHEYAPLQLSADGIIEVTTKESLYKKSAWNINLDVNAGFTTRAIGEYDLINNPEAYYETRFMVLKNHMYNIVGNWDAAKQMAAQNMIYSGTVYNIYNVPNDQIIDLNSGKVNSAAQIRYQDNVSDLIQRIGARQSYNLNASKAFKNAGINLNAGYLKEQSYIRNNDFDRINLVFNAFWEPVSKFTLGLNSMYSNAGGKFVDVDYFGATNSNLFQYMRQTGPGNLTFERDANGAIPTDPSNGSDQYSDWGQSVSWFTNNKRRLVNAAFRFSPYMIWDISDKLRFSVHTAFTDNQNDRVERNTVLRLLGMNVFPQITPGTINSAIGHSQMTINPRLNFKGNYGAHTWRGQLQYQFDNLNQVYFTGYSVDLPGWQSQHFDFERKDLQHSFDWKGVYGINNEQFNLTANLNYVLNNLEYNYKNTISERSRNAFNYAFRASWENKKRDLGFWGEYSSFSQFRNPNADKALKTAYDFYYSGSNIYNYWQFYNVVTPRQKQMELGAYVIVADKAELRLIAFDKTIDNALFYNNHPWAGLLEEGMSIRNRGLEFSLQYDVIKNSQIAWKVGLDMTHFKSKIKSLPNYDTLIGMGTINTPGEDLNTFYMPQMTGIDPQTGNPIFALADGSTTMDYNALTIQDYKKMGNPTPTVFGSFANNLRWKKFNLNVALAYSLGGKVYDMVYQQSMNTSISYYGNYHKDVLNAWTPENTNSTQPGISAWYGNAMSDRFLISASWLSLKQVMLGYDLPIKWFKQTSYQTMKIYLAGDNLLFLSARKGLNPNANFYGSVGNAYIPMRTAMLGVNINF